MPPDWAVRAFAGGYSPRRTSPAAAACYAYDPATYRFLSPDPASPSAADPLSLNAYAYCLGDPVGASDPSGAVVDVDGDGRLDPEDSASESCIRTPASSRHKAARRAEMVAAEARAQVQRAAELNRGAMMGLAMGRSLSSSWPRR